MPLEEFVPSIKYARAEGIKLILVHGETTVEPVIPGTNKKGLNCDIDILAHPGLITLDEAKLARDKGIFLELTARGGHSLTNSHLVNIARQVKAKLILNSDAHNPEDLLTGKKMEEVGRLAGLKEEELRNTFNQAECLLEKIKKNLDNQVK
jgi:histidinol phosphatase-like PHP family hydrolase